MQGSLNGVSLSEINGYTAGIMDGFLTVTGAAGRSIGLSDYMAFRQAAIAELSSGASLGAKGAKTEEVSMNGVTAGPPDRYGTATNATAMELLPLPPSIPAQGLAGPGQGSRKADRMDDKTDNMADDGTGARDRQDVQQEQGADRQNVQRPHLIVKNNSSEEDPDMEEGQEDERSMSDYDILRSIKDQWN